MLGLLKSCLVLCVLHVTLLLSRIRPTIATRKLLFINMPGSPLSYYDEYMKVLRERKDFEVIWFPNCRHVAIQKAVIKYKLGANDIIFVNQMCVNHFFETNASALSKIVKNMNCRIVFLNKEYSKLEEKVKFIETLGATLVLTHHHAIAEIKKAFKNQTTVARIPFATSSHYSKYAFSPSSTISYVRDIGHSGNNLYYDKSGKNNKNVINNVSRTLQWREKFHDLEIVGAFDSIGLNVSTVSYSSSIESYIRNIAESKIWFSTTSQGDLLPLRTYEVLASGRSLLLMNRPEDHRITDGILYEGEHCAMFNSTEELLAKAKYYITNEEERMKIVKQAYFYAQNNHLWKSRADTIRFLINDMNCGAINTTAE